MAELKNNYFKVFLKLDLKFAMNVCFPLYIFYCWCLIKTSLFFAKVSHIYAPLYHKIFNKCAGSILYLPESNRNLQIRQITKKLTSIITPNLPHIIFICHLI